jgi:DNA-binding MarR family transcriptional regulator
MEHTPISSGSSIPVATHAAAVHWQAETSAPKPGTADPFPLSSIGRLAREAVRARAQRGLFLNQALFSDPAWDILLDLFVAECEGRRRTVSTVGLAGKVPATTALRWINVLEREGLVSREDDPRDGRRQFLELTHAGLSAMTCYFQGLSRR